MSSLKIALRQTEPLEKKVLELHQKREPGQDAAGVMDEFVGIARSLETYGIDPHPVKDHRGTQLYLGINFSGISTFAAGRRAQHFRWPEVHKINFEGKMFIIHLAYTDDRREVVSFGYNVRTNRVSERICFFFFAEKAYGWIQVSVGIGVSIRVAMCYRTNVIFYVRIMSLLPLQQHCTIPFLQSSKQPTSVGYVRRRVLLVGYQV